MRKLQSDKDEKTLPGWLERYAAAHPGVGWLVEWLALQ